MVLEIIYYILLVIVFMVTSSAIVRKNTDVAIYGAISMAILTGLSFYLP